MSFSEKLKSERIRLGLTQAGAEAVLATCNGQVAAWESERNTPHVLTQEGALARLRNAIVKHAEKHNPEMDTDTESLIRALGSVIEGIPVERAMGAPGDWGYGTPIGDALLSVLQTPEEKPDLGAHADLLYSAYCEAVGGIAFNGDPLPSWADFEADPNKQKQADAWRSVAKQSLDLV